MPAELRGGLRERCERLSQSNFSESRRLPREVRRRTPATSKCRSSATAGRGRGAGRARLLGAAPQPEGHRGDAGAGPAPRRGAQGLFDAAVRLGERSATGPPARSSSSSTRTAGRSTSSRSTRACRSSTASPRRYRRRPGRVDGAPRAAATRASWTPTGTHRAGTPSRCASMPRTRRRISSRARGLLTEVKLARGARVRDLGRERHGGHALLRPDAGQDHRPRGGPSGGDRAMRAALAGRDLAGIETNLEYLRQVVATPEFADGRIITRSLGELAILDAQRRRARRGRTDHRAGLSRPRRLLGRRRAAVRADGPLAFRLANRLVGNDPAPRPGSR